MKLLNIANIAFDKETKKFIVDPTSEFLALMEEKEKPVDPPKPIEPPNPVDPPKPIEPNPNPVKVELTYPKKKDAYADFGVSCEVSNNKITIKGGDSISINGTPFVTKTSDVFQMLGDEMMVTVGVGSKADVTWEIVPNVKVNYIFRNTNKTKVVPQKPVKENITLVAVKEDQPLVNGELFTRPYGKSGDYQVRLSEAKKLKNTKFKNAVWVGDDYWKENGASNPNDGGYPYLNLTTTPENEMYQKIYDIYKFWRDNYNADVILQNGEFNFDDPKAWPYLALMPKAAHALGVKIAIWSTAPTKGNMNQIDRDNGGWTLNPSLTKAAEVGFDFCMVNANIKYSAASWINWIYLMTRKPELAMGTQWVHSEKVEDYMVGSDTWVVTPDGQKYWMDDIHSPNQLYAANFLSLVLGNGFCSFESRLYYSESTKDLIIEGGRIKPESLKRNGADIIYRDFMSVLDGVYEQVSADLHEFREELKEPKAFDFVPFGYEGKDYPIQSFISHYRNSTLPIAMRSGNLLLVFAPNSQKIEKIDYQGKEYTVVSNKPRLFRL